MKPKRSFLHFSAAIAMLLASCGTPPELLSGNSKGTDGSALNSSATTPGGDPSSNSASLASSDGGPADSSASQGGDLLDIPTLPNQKVSSYKPETIRTINELLYNAQGFQDISDHATSVLLAFGLGDELAIKAVEAYVNIYSYNGYSTRSKSSPTVKQSIVTLLRLYATVGRRAMEEGVSAFLDDPYFMHGPNYYGRGDYISKQEYQVLEQAIPLDDQQARAALPLLKEEADANYDEPLGESPHAEQWNPSEKSSIAFYKDRINEVLDLLDNGIGKLAYTLFDLFPEDVFESFLSAMRTPMLRGNGISPYNSTLYEFLAWLGDNATNFRDVLRLIENNESILSDALGLAKIYVESIVRGYETMPSNQGDQNERERRQTLLSRYRTLQNRLSSIDAKMLSLALRFASNVLDGIDTKETFRAIKAFTLAPKKADMGKVRGAFDGIIASLDREIGKLSAKEKNDIQTLSALCGVDIFAIYDEVKSNFNTAGINDHETFYRSWESVRRTFEERGQAFFQALPFLGDYTAPSALVCGFGVKPIEEPYYIRTSTVSAIKGEAIDFDSIPVTMLRIEEGGLNINNLYYDTLAQLRQKFSDFSMDTSGLPALDHCGAYLAEIKLHFDGCDVYFPLRINVVSGWGYKTNRQYYPSFEPTDYDHHSEEDYLEFSQGYVIKQNAGIRLNYNDQLYDLDTSSKGAKAIKVDSKYYFPYYVAGSNDIAKTYAQDSPAYIVKGTKESSDATMRVRITSVTSIPSTDYSRSQSWERTVSLFGDSEEKKDLFFFTQRPDLSLGKHSGTLLCDDLVSTLSIEYEVIDPSHYYWNNLNINVPDRPQNGTLVDIDGYGYIDRCSIYLSVQAPIEDLLIGEDGVNSFTVIGRRIHYSVDE